MSFIHSISQWLRVFPMVFSFLLSACVSQPNTQNFDKQQAAKARVELAFGYLQQQAFAQAKLNLDKALSYAPDYYLVHSALGYFYQQQGDIEQARQSYQRALKLDKKQGDVRNNYGALLCGQGDFSAAYEQFEQALATPNYYHQADTYENIVLCALAQKNTERYQQSLAALQKLDAARAAKLSQLEQ